MRDGRTHVVWEKTKSGCLIAHEVFVPNVPWVHACCGSREILPANMYPQVSPCPSCGWREGMSAHEEQENRREVERIRAFQRRILEQMDWS